MAHASPSILHINRQIDRQDEQRTTKSSKKQSMTSAKSFWLSVLVRVLIAAFCALQFNLVHGGEIWASASLLFHVKSISVLMYVFFFFF